MLYLKTRVSNFEPIDFEYAASSAFPTTKAR